MRRSATVAVGITTAFLLMGFGAAYANTIAVFVNGTSNPSIAPGSTVQIQNVYTGIPTEVDTLMWISVTTPSCDGLGNCITYILGGTVTLASPIAVFSGTGAAECDAPYGGPGAISVWTGATTHGNFLPNNPAVVTAG